MSETVISRIFAVKTTGGQERSVAAFVGMRAKLRKKPIYAILVISTMKGYVFFEAPNAQVVGDAIAGFKHVKSQVPGIIQFGDIEKFLITTSIVSELTIDDVVEVSGGPFKGMRAKVTRVEPNRTEATIILLDAPTQLPITINADYLRITEKAKEPTS